MCLDVPIQYRVIVEYPASSIDDIKLADEIIHGVADAFEDDMLDGGGSGFGFGFRDIDWDMKTEKSAENLKLSLKVALKARYNKETYELFEIRTSKIDNFECYQEVGCSDCYFAKGATGMGGKNSLGRESQ